MGLEVEMPGAEAETVIRCDREARHEAAIGEIEHLERARLLRRRAACVMAPAWQDRRFAVGRDHYLVSEDPEIEIVALRHRLAETAILMDGVYGDTARVVVGREQMAAVTIEGEVQGTPCDIARRAEPGQ